MDEAVGAQDAGAHRLELCRDLDAGGLTPGAAGTWASRLRGRRGAVNLLDGIGDAVEGDVWMLKAWLKRA